MAAPQVTPPGKWFAWVAVLAGLLPTLWAAGLSLYLLALAIGLSTTPDSLRTIGFLTALGAFLAVTLVGYWRVIWLCLVGRRVGATLWFGSALLILVWLGGFAWELARSGRSDLWQGLAMSLPPFALWAFALKRTY
jgi:hypothetical protein